MQLHFRRKHILNWTSGQLRKGQTVKELTPAQMTIVRKRIEAAAIHLCGELHAEGRSVMRAIRAVFNGTAKTDQKFPYAARTLSTALVNHGVEERTHA
jgi:hypothetical protein